ncbi:hypothetical protein LJR098_002111 [Rhizobium sp. LjRoot98]|uniref:hypothetical protein n=1 Tax=unclassified Rhizobium TaxID=2613769 RepID=UPI0012E3A949|nr:hypothetical protein [Rhizobium sp. Root1204]
MRSDIVSLLNGKQLDQADLVPHAANFYYGSPGRRPTLNASALHDLLDVLSTKQQTASAWNTTLAKFPSLRSRLQSKGKLCPQFPAVQTFARSSEDDQKKRLIFWIYCFTAMLRVCRDPNNRLASAKLFSQ